MASVFLLVFSARISIERETRSSLVSIDMIMSACTLSVKAVLCASDSSVRGGCGFSLLEDILPDVLSVIVARVARARGPRMKSQGSHETVVG